MHHQLELNDAPALTGCLTCLLRTEVLQRVSGRVGIKQEDSKAEISVISDQHVFLKRGNKCKRKILVIAELRQHPHN